MKHFGGVRAQEGVQKAKRVHLHVRAGRLIPEEFGFKFEFPRPGKGELFRVTRVPTNSITVDSRERVKNAGNQASHVIGQRTGKHLHQFAQK